MIKKLIAYFLLIALLVPMLPVFSSSAQEATEIFTTEDNTAASITYHGSWSPSSMGGAYHDTVAYSNITGDYVEYAFTGTSFSFIASKESNRGIAELVLDGISLGEVDLYHDSILRQQVVYTQNGLADKTHTLKVVVTGKQNPAANGCYVDIDAFCFGANKPYAVTRYDERDDLVSFYGSWKADTLNGAYQSTHTFSKVAGDYAEITFTGIGMALYVSREFNRGICDIYLDDRLVESADLYMPAFHATEKVFVIDDLENTTHTVKVYVTENKNASAHENYVDIDAIDIFTPFVTLEDIVKDYTLAAPKPGDTAIVLPSLPSGYTAAITATSHPNVISLDGSITTPCFDTLVDLTVSLSNQTKTIDKVYSFLISSRDYNKSVVMLDDTDKSLVYAGTWTHDPFPNSYCNTFSYSNEVGAKTSITFTGIGFTYYATKESNRGICEIVVDGTSYGEYDLYAAFTQPTQPVLSVEDLPNQEHTVEIIITGKKNNSSAGNYVDVDAFSYDTEFSNQTSVWVDSSSHEIAYENGSWGSSQDNGVTQSYSNTPGATATLAFEGTGVKLYCSKVFNRGICEVLLDGKSVTTYDLYSQDKAFLAEVFAIEDLDYTTHTLTVRVTGNKNESSADCYVDIDRIMVIKPVVTEEELLAAIEIPSPRVNDSHLTLPTLPKGFTLAVQDSEGIIGAGGVIGVLATEMTVDLTVSVSGKKTVSKTVTVTIPATPEITAYLSMRDKGASHDLRYVLLIKDSALASVEDIKITITFEKNGATVKAFSASVFGTNNTEAFKGYRSVTAAGVEYIAKDGYFYTGLVITNIPDGDWDTTTLTITDINDPSNVILETVSAEYPG